MAEVGCTVDDPSVLLERADLALTIARQFDDPNLEAKALADGGLALVELGRVGAGMDRLDEAMAQVTSGLVHDHLICGLTVCSFFTACATVNDFDRMQAWTEVLRRMSIVGDDGIAILTAHCSTVYGRLLWNVGRWREAETILEDAYQMSRPMNHGGRIHTATALAELRIQQGRLDEAEQLLLGYDDYMESLIPFAHLHLARGDSAMAAGVARRGLRLIGSDRVRKIALLSVLVEASLAAGDNATAEALAGELDDLAAHAELANLPMLAGEARYARARVFGAAGDTDRAIDELDRAVTALGGRDLPMLKSKIHVELARLHSSTDKVAALTEARAAVAIHARFESPFTIGAVGVLEDLGIPLTPPHAAPVQVLLSHRGGAWTLSSGARVFELRATKGLAYVAELIGNPGVERHVFDLVAVVDPCDGPGGALRWACGDAGPLLDAHAKQAYRQRVEDLRERVDDALALGRDTEAAQAQAEIDHLVGELARAVGLGGRDRRASAAAERARLNVTRAIRAAIDRLSQANPDAGAALDRDIHTGTFCSYQPAADAKVRWSID
jgi:tetratricopeptide (TPR) repeat protein